MHFSHLLGYLHSFPKQGCGGKHVTLCRLRRTGTPPGLQSNFPRTVHTTSAGQGDYHPRVAEDAQQAYKSAWHCDELNSEARYQNIAGTNVTENAKVANSTFTDQDKTFSTVGSTRSRNSDDGVFYNRARNETLANILLINLVKGNS